MTELKHILIVDDETPARNRLRDLLQECYPDIVLDEASNGQQALEMIASNPPQVVLLDIKMPVMDGIAVASHLQDLEAPPAVVFTTAYDNHAMQAFDLNAIDYLLKPIRLERLKAALQKAQVLLPRQLEAIKPLQAKRTHFSVLERGKVLLVPLQEVIYLRAELKYITIRTKEREYLIDGSLNALELEFAERFLRVHRNCLVAHQCIEGYEKTTDEHGERQVMVLLKEVTDKVAVSRRQMHLLKELGI